MNKTQLEYLEYFKNRLKNINIIEDIHYTVTIKDNEKSVIFKTITKDKKIIFSILGMILYFSNRKWIIDFEYLYILKSVQTVIFNDGTIEIN